MTKLCPRGKAAAKRKFKVYPSAYANAYASKICAGKIKDPSGVKRKDFKGPKPMSIGGKVMKAKRGRIMKKDPTKPVNPFEKKSSKFIERRKKLMGLKSVIGKGGRIGAAAALLGLAGAGAASLGQKIGKKLDEAKKKNKKMGGGMMKKYNTGGDANTMIKKSGIKDPKVIATAHSMKDKDRLTERDIKKAKSLVKGKMGGGMMKRPGYKKGKAIMILIGIGKKKPVKKAAVGAMMVGKKMVDDKTAGNAAMQMKKRLMGKKIGGVASTAGSMSGMGRLQKARMMNKGGDAKIKKVISGLHKASALHKSQAKSLQTVVGKSAGGMADYYKDLM